MAVGILLISEERISTVRHVEQLGRHIAETSGIAFRSVTVDQLQASDFQPGFVPLIVRGDSYSFYLLADVLTRARIPYVYFLDDNFWELDPKTELGQYYRSNVTVRRLERIIGGAEKVLVSTDALKEYLARFGDEVHQVNSFFDFSLIPRMPPQPDNGGVVPTHALMETRPAIDHGDNDANLDNDQRRAPRVAGAAADIGAYERQPVEKDERLLVSGFDGLCDQ